MKEKISCSLDGDLVNRIDDFIRFYPFISNRSALIETACVAFMYSYDAWASYDLTEQITFDRDLFRRDDFIRRMYERRCELNAHKESKN